jgi:hypothetical protein
VDCKGPFAFNSSSTSLYFDTAEPESDLEDNSRILPVGTVPEFQRKFSVW